MTLAGAGQMLVLVPLAGIAYLAKEIMAGKTGVWLPLTVGLVCLGLGMTLLTAGELLAHLADSQLTRRLRLALADRLSQVPLGWFSARSSGEIKQALQDDISTLHELTAHYYTTLARCVAAIAISAAYLLYLDWRLAILCLLPFPLFHLIFGAAKRAVSEERMRDFVAGQTRINSAVLEFIHGIPVLKAFGDTGRAYAGYREAVDGFAKAFLRFTGPLVAPMANANAIIAPVTVLGIVLGFGTFFASQGWIAPVDILPFALVAPGISAPLMLFGFLSHAVGSATGAAERIDALLKTPILEQPAPGDEETPDGHEIRFESVSYSPDGKNMVLSDISLALKPGTVTAIVGLSGAGKSTLARLLLRFFDPTAGRITLGGVELSRIGSAGLYRRIGFVMQEVRLIHASLNDNIALGRPSASRAEVEAAARAANIHERIVKLPRGYESVVGEDALLSGGEAQRVSIARSLILDAPVLVLDEATASADTESEAAIQDALSHFAQGRTLLVIAHRLDTVAGADQIIVLEAGRIVEAGRHDDLLAGNGLYSRLWHAGGYEGAEATSMEVQP